MFTKIALSALLVLCLTSQGMGQCSISDLNITTAETGSWAKGKPVRNVTVENTCICGQSDVIVDCTGLESTAPLVGLAKVDDNKCLVNNGDIIYGFYNATFTYAWNKVFTFEPVESQISCS